jgi:hypothetical protein
MIHQGFFRRPEHAALRRFFARDRRGREFHSHLLDPDAWRPFRVHGAGLIRHLPAAAADRSLWGKARWFSPRSFDDSFLSRLSVANRTYMRQER